MTTPLDLLLQATRTNPPAYDPTAPTDLYGAAVGGNTDRGLAGTFPGSTEVEKELRTKTPLELLIQGSNAAPYAGRYAQEQSRAYRDATNSRDFEEIASDTVSGIGSGLVNSVGGLAAWGLSGISPERSAILSDKLTGFNEMVEGSQSSGLAASRRQVAAKNKLDAADHLAQVDESDRFPQLNRMGKDAISAISNALSEPAYLGQGVSEGVGSILSGGMMGNAIRAGVAKAIPATATTTGKLAAIGKEALDIAPMAASIGLMEGGGAYQSTYETVMGMDTRDMMANSPLFNELMDRGMSADEAKLQIAQAAGKQAALRQAAIGAATGTIAARFEGNPFSAPSVGGVASNLGRETLEEGIQSASGQLQENIAVRDMADDTKDIYADVGQATGEGALFGLGTAGVMQAPIATGLTAKAAGKSALSVVGSLVQKATNKAKAESPVNKQDMAQAAFAMTSPEAVTEVTEAINTDQNIPQETKDTLNQAVADIQESFAYSPDFIEPVGFTEGTKAFINEGTNTNIDLLLKLSEVVKDKEVPESDRQAAQNAFIATMNAYDGYVAGLMNEGVLEGIDKDSPARKYIDDFITLQSRVTSIPDITEAIGSITENLKNTDVTLDESTINTPQGQQDIQTVLNQAELTPEKLTKDNVDMVLKHASDLSSRQLDTLSGIRTLLEAAQVMDKEAIDRGITRKEEVGIQVKTDPNFPSALSYASEVYKAVTSGNMEGAKDALDNLGLFAQHMSNKVDAYNKHYESGYPSKGIGQTYQQLGKDTRQFKESTKGVKVHPYNPGSVEFVNTVDMEASYVANVFNGLVDAFPELGGKQFQPTKLNTDLVGEPTAISDKFKRTPLAAQTPVQPVQETKPVDAPVTPEPVQVAPVEVSKDTVVEPVKVEQVEPVKETTPTPVEPVVEPTVNTPQIGNEKSQFNKVFKVNTETPKSRLVGKDSPAESVKQNVVDAVSRKGMLKPSKESQIDQDVVNAYEKLIDDVDPVVKQMTKQLTSRINEKDGRIRKLLDAGNEAIYSWNDSGALNIAEKVDGKWKYNKDKLESAVLAGLQWAVNSDNLVKYHTRDEVMEMFSTDHVPNEVMDFINGGVSVAAAKASLGQKIADYWGVSSDRASGDDLTRGIPQGVASELIRAFDALGFTKTVSETFIINGEPRTLTNIVPSSLDNAGINKFNDLIDSLVLNEYEKPVYIGSDASIPVSKTQLRNPLGVLSKKQQRVLRKAQEIPYTLVPTTANMLMALGMDNILNMFGAGQLDESMMNNRHYRSAEGKNRGIAAAYDHMVSLLSELQAEAIVSGKPIDQVPVRYKHEITRVGRMMMVGNQTPQSNKLIRSILAPNKSTIDLNNERTNQLYYTGIGQALGIKVHNQPIETTVSQVQGLLDGSLKPVVDAFREWNQDTSGELNGSMIMDTFKSAGVDLEFVSLSAVLDYAQMLDGDKSKHNTSVYIEADGMTNGPFFAMGLMTYGPFKENWASNMAKAGLYSQEDMTANKYRSDIDSTDLYQTTANTFGDNLTSISKVIDDAGVPELSKGFDETKRFFSMFIKGFDVDDSGSFDVSRNVSKNPLTVTLYGSGAKGIADKFMGEIADSIYERMTNVMRMQSIDPNVSTAEAFFSEAKTPAEAEALYKQYLNAISYLSTHKAEVNKKVITFKEVKGRTEKQTPQDFALTPKELENIASHIEVFMVDPMVDAIKKTVGGELMNSLTSIRDATQFQGKLFAEAYKQELAKANKEKGSFLSATEQEALMKDLMRYFPNVDTQDQSFFVSGSNKVEIDSPSYGRALDNSMKSEPEVYGPTDPGVRGIPLLVIGSGDGQMILNTVDNGSPESSRALYVYDGINYSIQDIDNGSLQSNKAVWETLQTNPIRDIYDSVKVTEQNIKELVDKYGKGIDSDELLNFQSAVDNLRYFADSIDDRNKVMREYQWSVDQMAAVGRPYVTEGSQMVTDDIGSRIESMNAVYDTDPEGRRNPTESIDSVKEYLKLDAENTKVMDEILKSRVLDEYQFTFNNTDAYGSTDVDNKIINISNKNPETVFHEIVHAATYLRTLEGLQPNADKGLRSLVLSTEKLMNDFMAMETNDDNAIRAKDTIQGYLNQDGLENRAAAINEFQAWGLSNESIRNLLRATKANPLSTLSKKVMKLMKRILFGSRMEQVRDDMLYHLGFNTRGMVQYQPTLRDRVTGAQLLHSPQYGTNERLKDLETRFFNKLLDGLPANNSSHMTVRMAGPIMDAYNAAKAAEAHGFSMTMQEAGAFRSIVAALSSDTNLDSVGMIQAQELYRHVMDNTVPNNKYFTLLGTFFNKEDHKGRSYLLPVFMGLAMTHEGFRKELSQMELPKKFNDYSSVDNALESVATNLMDKLSDKLVKMDGKDVKTSVDQLSEVLSEVADDRKNYFVQYANMIGTPVAKLNDIVVGGIQALSNKTYDTGESLIKSTNKGIRALGNSMQIVSAIASESKAAAVSESVQQLINKSNGWEPFTKFVSDMIGRTESNASVYDMIKASRSASQQIRQSYVESLPNIIMSKFKEAPSQETLSSLHKSIGTTDLVSVINKEGTDGLIDLVKDDGARAAYITNLESTIRTSDPTNGDLMIRKSKELAQYMSEGTIAPNLLRNAHAIANLLNEGRTVKHTDGMVDNIDTLVSLYSYNSLDQSHRDTLVDLLTNEDEGTRFLMSYMVGQRKGEYGKSSANDVTRFNSYKGYIPSSVEEGTHIRVAPLSEAVNLRKLGYTYVEDVPHEYGDGSKRDKAYFISPVSSKAPYSQGILQTVRESVNGVNPNTGYTSDQVSERITNPSLVRAIAARQSKDTNLIPVFDAQGRVIAYEKVIPNHINDLISKDTNIAKQIGRWRGRQVEESMAPIINNELIGKLHDQYTRDIAVSPTKAKEYINIFGTKDPVQQRVFDMLSDEVKESMLAQTNDGTFFIRKDMFDDALGYPAASVGDVWTGVSRLNPTTQKVVQDVFTSVLGMDAYAKMMKGEGVLRNVVADAKTIIVVKSVIVPAVNIISNTLQLIGRGVPVGNIAKAVPRKLTEIRYYTNQRVREIEAEAELRAASSNPNQVKKLEAEIQTIKDSYKNLSIWPLIEAGEFTSVSDATITNNDRLLTDGKLTSYIETLVDKLPPSAKTAGRYALITKDTALFKGLQRSVDYGDFIAKAIIFDDLVQRKKMTQEQALGRVTEEFVNYDRLTGRGRQFLESSGLLWFYNFKIRSTKIALSMMRNNPLQTLMASMVPLPDMFSTVGIPTDDSIIPKALEGSLGYSIGFGQGINSPFLNPWYAMTH